MKSAPGVLAIDPKAVTDGLVRSIQHLVHVHLRRKGVVLGLSGGIDSSVCAALCARALGAGNTLALLMPDRDSSPDSGSLATMLAGRLGIDTLTVDITGTVEAAGCY